MTPDSPAQPDPPTPPPAESAPTASSGGEDLAIPTRPPPAGPANRPSDGQTVRQTVETLVLALILALVARTFIAEPFVIPSGSMATTLLGDHAAATCPQCGYAIVADWPEDSRRWVGNDHVPASLASPETLVCPMCRYPVVLPEGALPARGDRVAVHKLPYARLTPNRWDVLVFKSPQTSPGPESNFIKRVIGLPGESLQVFEGDVYVRQPGQRDFVRASKVDRQTNRRWKLIQQAVFQPLYDSRYFPLDAADQSERTAAYKFEFPWKPTAGAWTEPSGPRPAFDGLSRGELRFDRAELARRDGARRYPYNQLKSQSIFEPLEDLRLRAWITPGEPGLAVGLESTTRLGASRPETVALRLDADGMLRLEAVDRPKDDPSRMLAKPVQLSPPKAGRAVHLELWIVDGAVLGWFDGREAVRWTSTTTLAQAVAGPAPQDKPDLALTLEGAPAVVERIAVERDLYYGVRRSDPGTLARGGLRRIESFETPDESGSITQSGPPAELNADQFFVAGDNGPISDDARFWTSVDPWVRARYFPDTPADDPDRFAGIVPRKLVVGRAFLVYYPNPFELAPGWGGVLPDLGRVRFIH
ncbi:MAG: S26 family signal peptidase [Planctomycetota bacterium]